VRRASVARAAKSGTGSPARLTRNASPAIVPTGCAVTPPAPVLASIANSRIQVSANVRPSPRDSPSRPVLRALVRVRPAPAPVALKAGCPAPIRAQRPFASRNRARIRPAHKRARPVATVRDHARRPRRRVAGSMLATARSVARAARPMPSAAGVSATSECAGRRSPTAVAVRPTPNVRTDFAPTTSAATPGVTGSANPAICRRLWRAPARRFHRERRGADVQHAPPMDSAAARAAGCPMRARTEPEPAGA